MKPLHIIISALLTALLLSGCVTPLSEDDVTRGTSTLTLSVGVDHPQLLTKAGETETPSLTDGSAFNSLLIALVNSQNQIVRTERSANLPGAGVTSTNITFAQLTPGDYHIYAFGNDDHTDWLEQETALSTLSEGSNMPTILLENDGTLTEPVGTGMILSGHKTVTIGGQMQSDSVVLSRPVVRFNVLIDNNTEYPVTLKDLSFSAFNASTTQLIDPRTSPSDPPLPPQQTYGSLPAYDKSSPKTIAHNGQMNVYSQLLFENAASVEYRMYASLEMDAGTEGHPDIHSLDIGTPTPVLIKAFDINNMRVGDSLRVMMLNPQKNSNNGRLIGYENGFVQQTKKTTGTTSSDYQQWLKTILANPALKKSYVLNLKKTGDNAYQLLDRKRKNLFSQILIYNTEDYLNNQGEMQGLPTTGSTGNFDGSFVNAGEPILMRFRYPSNVTNKPYYMWYRKDNNFSEGFWVYTDNTGNADRHFAFYQIKADGSPLRIINEDSGRIDPLTYMPRNTDITVVISVYYNGDGQAEVSYEVKGWVNTAEASHTFGIWTGMDGTN